MSEEKTPEQQLLEEYDVGDSAFDPVLDSPVEDLPPEKPPETPERARDEQGRFLPEKTNHPKSLVRMARDYGIAESLIDSMSTEDLADEVNVERLKAHSVSRDSRHLSPEDRQSPEGEQSPPTKNPETDDSLGLDEETRASIHEPILKLLQNQAREIRELKASLGAITQAEAARANESAVETADRIFAEDEQIFGKGKRSELKDGTPECVRRLAVWELARTQDGSVEQKIRKAREILFGKKEPTPNRSESTERQPAITTEEWEESALARPTQRQGSREPKGVRRAEKAVAARLRENGQTLDDFGPEEAGLPD